MRALVAGGIAPVADLVHTWRRLRVYCWWE